MALLVLFHGGILWQFLRWPAVVLIHSSSETVLYFNVGIDDKFGFEPETDWVKVIEVLGRF